MHHASWITGATFFEIAVCITAAWLAQLVERQSAVREVEGSSPRPDQHCVGPDRTNTQGLKITEKNVLPL